MDLGQGQFVYSYTLEFIFKSVAAVSECPGPLFTKALDVLPLDLVKSQSHEIGCLNWHNIVVPKFGSVLHTTAVEMPITFQSIHNQTNQTCGFEISQDQRPLLPTWINFNPSMDK